MRKMVITAAIGTAATMVAAAPASAQSWQWNNGRQVVQQINQLSQQIGNAQSRGRISPREANGLRRQVATVQQNYRIYSRGGLTRRETTTLQAQVNQVRFALRTERRDADRRRG